MESLIKSDVFFFITAVAVIVGSLLLAVIMIYLVRILNDVKHISGRVKKEADSVMDDVESLREGFLGQLRNLFGGRRKVDHRESHRKKE